MTPDGKMNAAAGAYAGLDRFEARKRIVDDLEGLGLLDRVTDHTHAVGICDRCKTVVEPRVSEQWFCRMKELAREAIAVVDEGLIPVVPENQRTIYLNWMANIRDWCISRQLWWGHRIPIWHCADCKAMTPATRFARGGRERARAGRRRAAKSATPAAAPNSRRIDDVLDTWFSSGPVAVFDPGLAGRHAGPARFLSHQPADQRLRHPVFLGCAHDHDGPASDEGPPRRGWRPCSFSRAVSARPGARSRRRENVQDARQRRGPARGDRKTWHRRAALHAGRDGRARHRHCPERRAHPELSRLRQQDLERRALHFLQPRKITGTTGTKIEELAAPEVRVLAPYPVRIPKTLADRWIFSRLARTVDTVNDALENFRFHEAAHVVYHFFWGDFCDWYIEWVKPSLSDSHLELAVDAWRNLFAVFEAALRLLHPFMPFLTEELWHRLPQRPPGAGMEASIALERFPEPQIHWSDSEAEEQVALLQELIAAARNVRAELKMDPKARVPAEASSPDAAVRDLLERNRDMVQRLAALSDFRISAGHLSADGGAMRATARFDLRIAHGETVDAQADAAKLRKEHERLLRDIESKQTRLADQTFRSRAPADIVAQMETTLSQRRLELEKIVARLAQLDSGAANSASE